MSTAEELQKRLARAEVKLERIRKAWRDPGVNPPYHNHQKARLCDQWPSLAKAVKDV